MGTSAINQLTTNSDVQVIREILFGEQSQRIQENFAKLNDLISALQQENQQLRQALESEAQSRAQETQQLRKSFEAEAKTREKENQARVKQIEEAQNQILVQINSLHEQLDRNLEQETGARQEAISGLGREIDDRFQEMQKEHTQRIDAVGENHQGDMKRLVSLLAAALADYQGQKP